MKAKKQPRNGVTPQLLLMENKRQSTKKEIQKRNSWILKREGNKITAKDGNVLYECHFCKGLGKSMFFANESDLKTHILRLHTGYPDRERENIR